jgi:neutral ceramidase
MKRLLLLVAAVVVVPSCETMGPYRAPLEKRRDALRQQASAGVLKVGTARADVTPPPGAATFGHGPDARLALGYWTRLYCRVFVFDTGTGDPLVLVPCDLHSIGNMLQRGVAEQVKDIVPPWRVMMSATHTHAGPAHYLESQAYGGALSSRYPGFDKRMLEFLAAQIGKAITEANRNKKEATVRWVHGSEPSLTRNRSIDAYRMNANAASADDELTAIDPALDVLEIAEAAGGKPLGSLTFFAMHPTVLPPTNRLFGGDVFAVTARVLEREMRIRRQDGGDPLAAVVNTNEGDLVPRYEQNTPDQAIRVGTALARSVLAASAAASDAATSHPALGSKYVELDMTKAQLCEPMLGQAMERGGADHRATTEHLLTDDPDSDVSTPCQGPKRKGMGIIQSFILGRDGIPSHVGLGVVELGDTVISFVPAEVTMTAGARLDAAVRAQTGAAHAVVAGLSNGYLQYVTTEDEYQMQSYEGGSVQYGPKTLGYFESVLTYLSLSLREKPTPSAPPGTEKPDSACEVKYETATQRERYALPALDVPAARLQGRRFVELCALPHRPSLTLCAIWEDTGPGRIWAKDDVGIERGDPQWVELTTATGGALARCASGVGAGSMCDPLNAFDDRGVAFQTRTAGPSAGGRWLWLSVIDVAAADAQGLSKAGPLAVQVRTANVDPLRSSGFTVAAPPADCRPEVARACLKDSPIEWWPGTRD